AARPDGNRRSSGTTGVPQGRRSVRSHRGSVHARRALAKTLRASERLAYRSVGAQRRDQVGGEHVAALVGGVPEDVAAADQRELEERDPADDVVEVAVGAE